MLIFSRAADDNLAGLVKALEEVRAKHPRLFTAVYGVGTKESDLEKLARDHKLSTPLAILWKGAPRTDAREPKLHKDAAVTVLVFEPDSNIIRHNFVFMDTKEAAAKARTIGALVDKAQK